MGVLRLSGIRRPSLRWAFMLLGQSIRPFVRAEVLVPFTQSCSVDMGGSRSPCRVFKGAFSCRLTGLAANMAQLSKHIPMKLAFHRAGTACRREGTQLSARRRASFRRDLDGHARDRKGFRAYERISQYGSRRRLRSSASGKTGCHFDSIIRVASGDPTAAARRDRFLHQLSNKPGGPFFFFFQGARLGHSFGA